MIFAPPRCAWNAAWHPWFAKNIKPKNFPRKPWRTEGPTTQRESRNLLRYSPPGVALDTLRGAHALQKFRDEKFPEKTLEQTRRSTSHGTHFGISLQDMFLLLRVQHGGAHHIYMRLVVSRLKGVLVVWPDSCREKKMHLCYGKARG